MISKASPIRYFTRRAAGVAMAALAAGALVAPAGAAAERAAEIASHFAGVRTMAGEFVQFGPRGEQTGGKFYIERPGKIRFNYEEPSGFYVVSDGDSVVIRNKKLNTADLYPLSKTPLKLLLGDSIDLSGPGVQTLEQNEDITRIRMTDKSLFGESTITMIFDSKTYDLRQWTITDAQGKDTTVQIFNVQQGVQLDPRFFEIDYRRVDRISRDNRNNR